MRSRVHASSTVPLADVYFHGIDNSLAVSYDDTCLYLHEIDDEGVEHSFDKSSKIYLMVLSNVQFDVRGGYRPEHSIQKGEYFYHFDKCGIANS